MKTGEWLAIIAGVITALITSGGGVIVGKIRRSSDRDNAMSDHYFDLLDRIDKLTEERDNLKSENIELKEELKKEEESKNGSN